MNRSVFLLIVGLYTALVALAMIFVPEAALKNYGIPAIDVHHIGLIQFLGISNGVLGLLLLLNRNAPNSVPLQTLLLGLAVLSLAGVLLGAYRTYILNIPGNAFFLGDSLLRLALGLGFLYFYNRETKSARAGAVPA
jgi:hypothetical protein